jgi:predicted nucleotidyltransferase
VLVVARQRCDDARTMKPTHRVFARTDVNLPRGTRVILRFAAVDDAGVRHRPGILGVVRETSGVHVVVETPGGSVLRVTRDDVALQKEDQREELARRQWDHRRLREQVVYAAVVGSRAWNLHTADSDEDVRGCFVLPFDVHASLYDAPDEIHDDERQEAYWEIEKLVRQALRADPNTLETLWSPLVRTSTPLGDRLVRERAIFSSRRVVGSFGRYAETQLTKLSRASTRAALTASLLDDVRAGRVTDVKSAQATLPPDEDVHAVVRSLYDRGLIAAASFDALLVAVKEGGVDIARLVPDEVRPKNAYNLVRLLHSCLHWLKHGEPLIRVEGVVRDELLDIKQERTPLDATLARAEELVREIEARANESTPLPDEPDVDAADALVRAARTQSARAHFAPLHGVHFTHHGVHFTHDGAPGLVPGERSPGTSPGAPTQGGTAGSPGAPAMRLRWFPAPVPPDVELGGVRRFLEQKLARLPAHGASVVVSLTGAHAYGFPSPDSDLDLKAIHACPARALLGLGGEPAPLEVVEIFEGREMDLSSHEIGQAAALLLKGNGNMLERLLGPMTLVDTPVGEQLAAIAQRALSRRVVHHYRGFLGAMKRESDIEARDAALPDARHKGRTAKRLLYAYRVAFTGAQLLLGAELVTDVRDLAPMFGFTARVDELIQRKQSGEYSVLTEAEAAPYLADWPKLEQLLHDAFPKSVLPPEPPDAAVAELDALVIEARLTA